MINARTLSVELRQQVDALRDDLRRQLTHGRIAAGEWWDRSLRDEFARARAAGRTGATWETWRDDKIDQAAVSWVLGMVLVRFAEDNGLVGSSALADPSPEQKAERRSADPHRAVRDWLLRGLDAGSATPAGRQLFERERDLLYRISPSTEAAEQLIAFWRRRDESGRLLQDFTDPGLDTRFLTDLYQDLSESARKTYALIRTPEFVVELILELTLDPAMEEFGYQNVRVIDPVCGSGQFVLGAFERLVRRWSEREPTLAPADWVRRGLAAVHGIDINPASVMITRFRLLVTALRICGLTSFDAISTEGWNLNVIVGDSLLDGSAGGLTPAHEPRGSGRTIHDKRGWAGIAEPGGYHVVVGNPPYVTVRDRQLHHRYQERYSACVGMYPLTVPFFQRFFELAQPADRHGRNAGYVGQLTANSFMKREFGRRLIEEFFAKQVLITHLIDTSGAYIPGHASPTVILIGRNRPPTEGLRALAVLGVRGEPVAPVDPARGIVWQSILRHSTGPGQADQWTRSLLVEREHLSSFPWQLADSAATEVLGRMSAAAKRNKLSDVVERIGYFANTGSDGVFTAASHTFRRMGGKDREALIRVLTGSEVRDWIATAARVAFFPRQGGHPMPAGRRPRVLDLADYPGHLTRLWPLRTVLGNRPNYSRNTYFADGRVWYDWHQVTDAIDADPWVITFPWVATHNHFVLLRDHVAPLNSAPVIRLKQGASWEDHGYLLALLNSSAVCFWMKQHSNSKGQLTADGTRGPGTNTEPWTNFYEFTASRLADLPLPADHRTVYAQEINRLAERQMTAVPAAVLADQAPSAGRLATAHRDWDDARSKMIALQEELDWEIYACYGLLADDGLLAPAESVPPLHLGERSFEIVMARRMASGGLDTAWFARHGSTPTTEIPKHWPSTYRDVVRRRIAAIEADEVLAVVEQPEFKRRWAGWDWGKMQAEALREWLLDRCDTDSMWYEDLDYERRPRPLTTTQLAELLRKDPSVLAVAELYAPGRDLAAILEEIIADEHVPYLAALRYRDSGMQKRAIWERVWDQQRQEDAARAVGDVAAAIRIRDKIPIPPKYTATDFLKPAYWRQRGKFDMPNERFLSYPVASPTGEDGLLIGWAGWRIAERAQVLFDLITHHIDTTEGNVAQVVPMLAGLLEILQWMDQPSIRADRAQTVAVQANYASRLHDLMRQLNITQQDIETWRPPKPKRGRPPKLG